MDMLVAMGVAAIIEALQNKKNLQALAPKIAKVFVAIERAAQVSPTLSGAIEAAKRK
jgi:hypothetical protein